MRGTPRTNFLGNESLHVSSGGHQNRCPTLLIRANNFHTAFLTGQSALAVWTWPLGATTRLHLTNFRGSSRWPSPRFFACAGFLNHHHRRTDHHARIIDQFVCMYTANKSCSLIRLWSVEPAGRGKFFTHVVVRGLLENWIQLWSGGVTNSKKTVGRWFHD